MVATVPECGGIGPGPIPVLGLINLVAVMVSLAFSGPLSDRIGRRKPIVIAAAVVMGVAMIVPLLLPTVTGMIVFTAICSLGFGAYMSVDAALMSEVLPPVPNHSAFWLIWPAAMRNSPHLLPCACSSGCAVTTRLTATPPPARGSSHI